MPTPTQSLSHPIPTSRTYYYYDYYYYQTHIPTPCQPQYNQYQAYYYYYYYYYQTHIPTHANLNAINSPSHPHPTIESQAIPSDPKRSQAIPGAKMKII